MLNLQRRSACTVGDWFHPDPAMNLLNPSVEELPSAPECVPPNDPLGRDQFPDENANGIVCCQPAPDMKDWPAGQDEGAVWRGVKGVDLSAKFPKKKELYWWAFSSTTKASI